MGLLDKVKETAAKAGEAAKKGAAQVKDKVGDAQLQKKADDDAKAIGYLIVAEKAEGQAAPAGEIDRLVAEIVELRTQMAEVPEILQKPEGAVQAESAPATSSEQAATGATTAPPAPASASEPTSGDFKLD
jgi:hypothetical protein